MSRPSKIFLAWIGCILIAAVTLFIVWANHPGNSAPGGGYEWARLFYNATQWLGGELIDSSGVDLLTAIALKATLFGTATFLILLTMVRGSIRKS